jgi:hypothetical protein
VLPILSSGRPPSRSILTIPLAAGRSPSCVARGLPPLIMLLDSPSKGDSVSDMRTSWSAAAAVMDGCLLRSAAECNICRTVISRGPTSRVIACACSSQHTQKSGSEQV